MLCHVLTPTHLTHTTRLRAQQLLLLHRLLLLPGAILGPIQRRLEHHLPQVGALPVWHVLRANATTISSLSRHAACRMPIQERHLPQIGALSLYDYCILRYNKRTNHRSALSLSCCMPDTTHHHNSRCTAYEGICCTSMLRATLKSRPRQYSIRSRAPKHGQVRPSMLLVADMYSVNPCARCACVHCLARYVQVVD